MKTLVVSERVSGHVIFDEETKELSTLESERESINWIRIAPEDMKLMYVDANDEKKTIDVKKDQLIIRFYDNNFPHRLIVVDSKEWVENITNYNKKMEESRNEYALKKKCMDCDACETCEASC